MAKKLSTLQLFLIVLLCLTSCAVTHAKLKCLHETPSKHYRHGKTYISNLPSLFGNHRHPEKNSRDPAGLEALISGTIDFEFNSLTPVNRNIHVAIQIQ